MRTRTTTALLLSTFIVAIALGAGGGRPAAVGTGAAAEGGARLLGHEFGETKQELKLDYDVEVHDNGGGRVSVVFTIADEGRLKPISSFDVAAPSKDKSGYYDLVVPMAVRDGGVSGGKRGIMFQLTRDLAERGEIDLKTSTFDGKQMMEWGYHRVSLAAALKAADEKAKNAEKKSPDKKNDEGGTAPAATPASGNGR